MAEPRTLRFVVDCEDAGGEHDYDQIMDALTSVGEIVSEMEVSPS